MPSHLATGNNIQSPASESPWVFYFYRKEGVGLWWLVILVGPRQASDSSFPAIYWLPKEPRNLSYRISQPFSWGNCESPSTSTFFWPPKKRLGAAALVLFDSVCRNNVTMSYHISICWFPISMMDRECVSLSKSAYHVWVWIDACGPCGRIHSHRVYLLPAPALKSL